MTTPVAFTLLFDALALGSFYALVSLGFALVFGVTRIFNLAHGPLVVLGGYVAYFLERKLSVPFWPAMVMAMIFSSAMAGLLSPMMGRIRDPVVLNSLVVTLGLAVLLENAMLFLFSANYRVLSSERGFFLLPWTHWRLSRWDLVVICLSLWATAMVYGVLRRTFFGKALRATIQDREAARLAGIPVYRMGVWSFFIGGALIGLAGPIYARWAYLHPAGGMEPTLIAIIVTIFAGVGRIRSLLVGAWLLGLLESVGNYFLGTGWRELISAVVLIAILLWRPEGILGEKRATTSC